MNACLTDTEKNAILRLLEDEDPATFEAILQRVESRPEAHDDSWLSGKRLDANPLVRRRALKLIEVLGRRREHQRFLHLLDGATARLKLETYCFALAKTRYPEVNPEGYGAWLDWVAAQAAPEIGIGMVPESIIATLNNLIFDDLGFMGNQADYYDPANSYLNQVIDTRSGNPISLCVVYLLVARRLRLPIYGVGAPTHFLCVFQGAERRLFIDAFHGGKILTESDCRDFLKQVVPDASDSVLGAAPPQRVLSRMLHNLRYCYRRRRELIEVLRIETYLKALEGAVA